ncbi:hypothetical protein [Halopseudomonas sp.]|uniref:hypothetical protein n=1 Tax=Halopseudomonas sp. TaxID=2901191 RepID=UPI00311DB907
MFEGIRHISSQDDFTCAIYDAEVVSGSLSFHNSEHRSAVSSNIGPADAVRECSASHFLGEYSGRFMARVAEEVNDYS